MELSPFAQRLKDLMDERGIELSALASATGIPYHRMYPWFRRPNAKPRSSDIVKLGQYFKVPWLYLLEGGERAEPDQRANLIARLEDLDPTVIEKLEAYLDGLLARDPPRSTD